MTISVVIPVLNGEKWIRSCLASVINQTLQPDEILVVDAGSTDRSLAIVEAFLDPRITGVAMGHSLPTPSHARNVGVQTARGRYVAFLDCDDLWARNHLKDSWVRLMERDVEAVASGAREFCPGIRPPSDQPHSGATEGAVSLNQLLLSNFIATSSVVVRRSVVCDVGGFEQDHGASVFEDWLMWLKIVGLVGMNMSAKPSVWYRRCEGVPTFSAQYPRWGIGYSNTMRLLDSWMRAELGTRVPFGVRVRSRLASQVSGLRSALAR